MGTRPPGAADTTLRAKCLYHALDSPSLAAGSDMGVVATAHYRCTGFKVDISLCLGP